MNVAVIGSINFDRSLRVERLPLAGQTVHCTGVATGLGGKGANQAIAAALSGAHVAFLGAVGDDSSGRYCLDTMEQHGVCCESIEVAADAVTGEAVITVDRGGANHIVVVPGANGTLQTEQIGTFLSALTPGTPVLLQGEVPVEANQAALEFGAQTGLRTILNVAPYAPALAALADNAWCLLVNESEAAALMSEADPSIFLEAGGWVSRLSDQVPRWIVTLGAAGAWAFEPDSGLTHIEPVPCPSPVDSTGAGDAFAGALAAGLAHGLGLMESAQLGARAGSAVCRFPGASESFAQALTPISLEQ